MTEIKVSKTLEGDNVCKTLNEALDKAKECDKIYICSGLYREQVYITTQVYIYAEKGTLLIFDNNRLGSAVMAISEECTIENLNVKSTNGHAVQINYCNNVKFKNGCFSSLQGDCMSIHNSDYLEFSSCKFESIGDSIYYTSCFGNKCLFINCDIKSEKGYGLNLTGEANVNLKKSKLETIEEYNIKLKKNSSVYISNSVLLYPKHKSIIVDYGNPQLNPNFNIE